MNTTIVRPATQEAWLAERQKGIGSSEIATLAGLNPYESPYQLWLARTGQAPAKAQSQAMRLGHLLEGSVAQLFEDATGLPVDRSSEGDWIVRRTDKPWLQVSPDRTYSYPGAGGEARTGILEIKTTQRRVDQDSIPDWWFCQLQYQLGVAELERGALAWLTAGFSFGYTFIDFNPEFFQFLEGLADTFVNENLKGNTPPAPLTAADVLALFPKEKPGAVAEASDEVYAIYVKLKDLRETQKQQEEECSALEDALKVAIGEAEALAYQGAKLATWKAPKPSARFDAKSFKEAHPDLYSDFTKEVPSARRFLLK